MTVLRSRRPVAAPLVVALLLVPACGGTSSTGDDSFTGADAGSTVSSSSGSQPGTTTAASTSLDSSAGSGSASGGSSSGSASTSTGSVDTTQGSSSGEGSSSESGTEPGNGCADGEREVLVDEAVFTDIAGCNGGWSVPGVFPGTTMCNREGGDDGVNPVGMGCTVEDLCSEGWHLCTSAAEVADAGITNCSDRGFGGGFYATAQSGNGSDTCSAVGTNDVFGCGEVGHTAINGCAPLNRSTANLCEALPKPWSCDISDDEEAQFITKAGPQFGGVLCCRD
ncbi:MAG: hypothetical protein K0V04_24840 [Deltaproteobacteria bacterium]|nr:hypothetical protein [Deltaproteobacteria bacterium]